MRLTQGGQDTHPASLPARRLVRGGWAALAGLTLALPAWCAAPPEATAANESPFEAAVVAVTVNGTHRGDLFVQRAASGRLAIRREDLPAIGLQLAAPAAARIDGVEHVWLDTVPGLTLALDAPTQTLSLMAPPALLARTVIQAPPNRHGVQHLAGEGAFLNWALEQAFDSPPGRTPPSLALEAGAWLGPTLWLSRGQTVRDEHGRARFVRLMTSVTRDVPARQARWTFGDLFTTPDELGQGLLVGGISYATLARLDPYRIRHPLGTVQGQALLPSDVEVYVDGQRVRTERVPAGVFEIRDLLTPLGARSVQLLVRDAYGRVQRFDQSFYASTRLLAPGMHDFQYALGVLRRGFGDDSSRYGEPVFSARHAWGLTSALTVGLRAEGRAGWTTGGASLTLKVASAGLLGASLATSRTEGISGHAALWRYEYQSAGWGLGVTHRADTPGYAALGEDRVLGNRRHETLVYASRALDEGRSLWVSHSQRSTRPSAPETVPTGWLRAGLASARSTSIGFAAPLRPWGGSLRLTASRTDTGRGPRSEFSASLVFLLDGGGLLATQHRQGPEGDTQSAQWSRPPPVHEGWGLDLGATRGSGPAGVTQAWRAATQFESPVIRLRAQMQDDTRSGQQTLRVSAAGALAFLGGRWHPSRPLEDGYALVQVPGLAGIPVTVNGMPAGVTDARGQRLIPRISAHHDTVIGIDAGAVPIDLSIADVQRRVVLPERGGATIRFEARPVRALAAQLIDAKGTPLARTRIWIGIGTQALETLTGLQGELYLENLAAGTHPGEAEGPHGRCRFELHVPRQDEVIIELGPVACTPDGDDQNRSVGPR